MPQSNRRFSWQQPVGVALIRAQEFIDNQEPEEAPSIAESRGIHLAVIREPNQALFADFN